MPYFITGFSGDKSTLEVGEASYGVSSKGGDNIKTVTMDKSGYLVWCRVLNKVDTNYPCTWSITANGCELEQIFMSHIGAVLGTNQVFLYKVTLTDIQADITAIAKNGDPNGNFYISQHLIPIFVR